MAMESDHGKLFIGGISWETTEEKLKSYFSAFGEVIEAVIMKDRATGRARGFGFIVFADPTVADRVVLDKHSIDGRMVEAKKAVPRDDQQIASKTSNGSSSSAALSSPARTKKIFVGGLPSSLTESDFKKYFGQFGAITDVVVMYDHGTHRPRGFGFITYESEDSVDNVLQKTFHELNEKMVEVKRAIPKELSAGSTRSNGIGFGAGAGGRGTPYTGSYAQAYSSSPILPYAPQIDSRYDLSPISNRALYSPYGAGGLASPRAYNGFLDGACSPGLFCGSPSYAGANHGPIMHRGSSFGAAYGGAPNSNNFHNDYSSISGRNVWGNGETMYDTLNGSAGIEANLVSSLSGLLGMRKLTTSQAANSFISMGEKNSYSYEGADGGPSFSNSAAYGGDIASHGGSLGDHGPSRSHAKSSMFLGDLYGSFSFGDSTWRTTPADKFRFASAGFDGLGSGVYGLPRSHDGPGDDAQAVDSGCGVQTKPTYRGL